MPDPTPTPSATMVESDAGLAAACRRWSKATTIGLDTEFIRERTYYPRPALLQVSDAEGVVLVDPLRISDFGPFADILNNPNTLLVMHACGEDLEVLDVMTGTTPQRIFDTQLAGAFAGHGFSLGYRDLVAALLQTSVDKGETRSNWLQRPLTPAQLHYAALDVIYLGPMHRHLTQQLKQKHRLNWVTEEFGHQRRARAEDSHPTSAYRKVRGRGSLTPPHHAALRALATWRETEAMAQNRPRRHVLPDDALMGLARALPSSVGDLTSVRGLSSTARQRYGQTLLDCIAEARSTEPAELDRPMNFRPHAEVLKLLKAAAAQSAETLDLPPELVATRRGLEALLTNRLRDDSHIPPEFNGWRRTDVTNALLACLPKKAHD